MYYTNQWGTGGAAVYVIGRQSTGGEEEKGDKKRGGLGWGLTEEPTHKEKSNMAEEVPILEKKCAPREAISRWWKGPCGGNPLKKTSNIPRLEPV